MYEFVLALYIEGNNKIKLNNLKLAEKEIRKKCKKIKIKSLEQTTKENTTYNYIYFSGKTEDIDLNVPNVFAKKHNLKWALSFNNGKDVFRICDENKALFNKELTYFSLEFDGKVVKNFLENYHELKKLTVDFLNEEEYSQILNKLKEKEEVNLEFSIGKEKGKLKLKPFLHESKNVFYWNE